jgi:hypothetical protein
MPSSVNNSAIDPPIEKIREENFFQLVAVLYESTKCTGTKI